MSRASRLRARHREHANLPSVLRCFAEQVKLDLLDLRVRKSDFFGPHLDSFCDQLSNLLRDLVHLMDILGAHTHALREIVVIKLVGILPFLAAFVPNVTLDGANVQFAFGHPKSLELLLARLDVLLYPGIPRLELTLADGYRAVPGRRVGSN